jgi:acetate---CoA ligase (ADP-forming)
MLEPKSIAVIGASDRAGNLGGVAIGLLRKFGYPGEVWPVHPTSRSVAGYTCYPSIAETPSPADLVILAVRAAACPALVRECASAGVTTGIIWSGGFAEGGPDGADLQQRLVEACQETGFTVLGPNCLGIIDTHLPATTTFASFLRESDELVAGNISMISQSGGLATMTQAMAARLGFGFRYMISTGNEAVVGVPDFFQALVGDPLTKVVCAYLEGVREGEALVTALENLRDAGKPVVVLKAGATAASAAAATAHTGALVGERRVWSAVFDEFGVIQTASLEELLDVALELSSMDADKIPVGTGLAAVTFGGGMGVLAADQAVSHGLETPQLSAETRARLRPLVPPVAAIGNPVDLTPQSYLDLSWLEHLPAALDVIAADPLVDMVLVQAGPMATGGADVARIIAEFRRRAKETVSVAWALPPPGITEQLQAAGCHVFEESERAIRSSASWWHAVDRVGDARRRCRPVSEFDWGGFVPRPSPGEVVPEHRCREILAAAGLTVAPGRLATTEDDAVDTAGELGYPVAMKGISTAVSHRAASGLMALSVADEAGARSTYRTIGERAVSLDVHLEGVYVQSMIGGGAEFLVSGFRDPTFGSVVSVAAGGTMTELIDDVVLLRAPFDQTRADEALPALKTVATDTKAAMERLSHLSAYCATFSRLVAGAPWDRFVFEVNPVIVRQDLAVAVDGLLIIEST